VTAKGLCGFCPRTKFRQLVLSRLTNIRELRGHSKRRGGSDRANKYRNQAAVVRAIIERLEKGECALSVCDVVPVLSPDLIEAIGLLRIYEARLETQARPSTSANATPKKPHHASSARNLAIFDLLKLVRYITSKPLLKEPAIFLRAPTNDMDMNAGRLGQLLSLAEYCLRLPCPIVFKNGHG
jgi:hypothetical protein